MSAAAWRARGARAVLGAGAASGLLFWASIPRAEVAALAWVFLVPLLLLLPRATPNQLFWAGLVAGVVAATGRTYWIAQTLQLYGHVPLPLALLTNLLLIAYLGLYWAFFLPLCRYLGFPSLGFPWAAASLWAVLEWGQTWLLSGFPWELVGYSQYRQLALLQVASLTGVHGLSFLVVLANGALAQGLAPGWRGSARLGQAALPALLLAAAVLWGGRRLAEVEAPAEPPLRVGIVQGNVPQDVKWRQAGREGTTRHYLELTRTLREPGLDLVVFPETALPYFLADESNAALRAQVANLARELGAPILVGSLGGSWDEGIYNRAFLVDADGALGGHADKAHLVPFGEYLPFPWIFGYLGGLTAESGAFAAGGDHRAIPLGRGGPDLGVFICYESIFPEITRRLATSGASVLVNTTNDAWFGRTAAPYQHLSMAAVRAAEVGRPVVRAANTGISGLIAASGRILATTQLEQTVALVVHPSPRRQSTAYTRHGDWLVFCCTLVLLGHVVARALAGHRPAGG
ncbi:MAG: apolipoprotein N-acyltransferase [Candidatus Latescibacterota bacterium]